MGKYVNWPDGRGGQKKELARSIGAVEVDKDAADAVMKEGTLAVLVWVNNGPFEALAWAYDYREFQAFTLPHDGRDKAFFIVDKAVAEANAK